MYKNDMKRSVVILLCALVGVMSVVAKERQTREEYVEKYKAIAIAHMERYGIPASITMAQGILESDSGNSYLSRTSNNHFGIKCKKSWTGERVYHDDDAKGECFRAYPSVEASYQDHADFLDQSPRYDSLFVYASDDYRSWARGLKACGYATAPDYAERLVKIIESMKLYLLDKENGNKIYAAAKTAVENVEEWWESNIATSDEQINPNAFRVTVNSHKGYGVYRSNHTFYVVAKEGDTFESVGEIFDISPKMLRKFNDVAKDAKLSKGDIVYIERKKTQWLGNVMQHKVVRDENLYSLSQSYGIRLKSLIKLNRMREGEDVKSGDIIRLK
jgi:LysM repeat protein